MLKIKKGQNIEEVNGIHTTVMVTPAQEQRGYTGSHHQSSCHRHHRIESIFAAGNESVSLCSWFHVQVTERDTQLAQPHVTALFL